MGAYDAFQSLFLRYRKRKQISVDGHTPGLEYTSRPRGSTDAPSTGYVAQRQHIDDYLGGQDATTYDPRNAFYSLNAPHYRPPEPSWSGAIPETPPLRMPLPPAPGPLKIGGSCPLDDVRDEITERREADLLENPDNVDPHPILFEIRDGISSEPADSLILDSPSDSGDAFAPSALNGAMNDFRDSVESASPDPLAAAEEIFNQQMESFHHMADQASDINEAMSLEQIVEREMAQADPFALEDPYQLMNPFGPLPPPGMPMNPFGPMGMGM